MGREGRRDGKEKGGMARGKRREDRRREGKEGGERVEKGEGRLDLDICPGLPSS